MPLMERDKHEALLSELLTPELEQSRKTEILTALRADHVGGQTDYTAIETTNKKYLKDNNDLVLANSQLFRQAGVMGKEEKDDVVVQKQFSETVTLEQLEKAR